MSKCSDTKPYIKAVFGSPPPAIITLVQGRLRAEMNKGTCGHFLTATIQSKLHMTVYEKTKYAIDKFKAADKGCDVLGKEIQKMNFDIILPANSDYYVGWGPSSQKYPLGSAVAFPLFPEGLDEVGKTGVAHITMFRIGENMPTPCCHTLQQTISKLPMTQSIFKGSQFVKLGYGFGCDSTVSDPNLDDNATLNATIDGIDCNSVVSDPYFYDDDILNVTDNSTLNDTDFDDDDITENATINSTRHYSTGTMLHSNIEELALLLIAPAMLMIH